MEEPPSHKRPEMERPDTSAAIMAANLATSYDQPEIFSGEEHVDIVQSSDQNVKIFGK